jgi:signal peptidase I
MAERPSDDSPATGAQPPEPAPSPAGSLDANVNPVTTGQPDVSLADLPAEPWLEPPPTAGAIDREPIAPPPERAKPRRGAARTLRELAETVILAVVIFLIVRAAVQNFQVEGSSMDPTLHNGLYLLVNKAVYFEINLETLDKFLPFIDPGDDPTRYLFRGPRRGDVIVFVAPEQVPGEAERDFIKRIIAVPGETVEVRNDTVFINGKPLDEPYIRERPNYIFGPQTVPEGHYFVLGDNRNESFDSHAWADPWLPKENIIGLAWVNYWDECGARGNWCPDFGLIDNTSVKPGDAPAATPASTASPTPFSTGGSFP